MKKQWRTTIFIHRTNASGVRPPSLFRINVLGVRPPVRWCDKAAGVKCLFIGYDNW